MHAHTHASSMPNPKHPIKDGAGPANSRVPVWPLVGSRQSERMVDTAADQGQDCSTRVQSKSLQEDCCLDYSPANSLFFL